MATIRVFCLGRPSRTVAALFARFSGPTTSKWWASRGPPARLRGCCPCLGRTSPVLDVRLPDGSGIEVCRTVRALDRSIRALILSGFDDQEVRRAATAAGACGFVAKSVRGTALVDAVRAVAGGTNVSADPSVPLKDPPAKIADGVDPRLTSLTPQEHRLVVHLAAGLTNRQLGELMLLSEKTVKNYLTSAMAKMGMTRRTEVAVFSARHDWSQ